MTQREMRYWSVLISVRWDNGSYHTDADIKIDVAAFDEGHAIACATAALLKFGSPSEVFGAKATEITDGGKDE